jgi:hypothetical protein
VCFFSSSFCLFVSLRRRLFSVGRGRGDGEGRGNLVFDLILSFFLFEGREEDFKSKRNRVKHRYNFTLSFFVCR